jgi:hypothetical protein
LRDLNIAKRFKLPTASQKKDPRKYIMENNLRSKAEMDPPHE